MKTVLIIAAAAVALSGCAALSGGSAVSGDALVKILTDPACDHDDQISFVTGAGGIPASLSGSAKRHCVGTASAPTVVTVPAK